MNNIHLIGQRQLKESPKRKKRKPNYFKTPKGNLLIILIGLAALVSIATVSYHGLLNMGVAVVTSVLLDYAVMRLQKRKRLVPDGALLTGIIIGMVMSPVTHWQIVFLTAAISIASKHLLAFRKKPIFNPAAFGLLVVLLLFSTGQDWWGGLPDLSAWFLIVLLAGGYWVTSKVRKFPLVFTFLGLYFSVYLAIAMFGTADVSDMFRVPFLNSALFLAFFMMTDPPTSPSKPIEQVLFSLVAVGISAWINLSFGGLSFLLAGLLSANLWHTIVSAIKRAVDKTR
ncbi:RnfABCDGE type electron transport complex subunit D [Gorillibacterium massiliense]|uniref:RnfABCDGE type electron transport complex subunit D n=1 Tax=Gorillibacterium massiliense TaxID=1280390 RepID=UPI0004B6AF02|nr:RnfABCDGE type electron transport complex subunit D [Gorillibacterium massiliense]